MEDFSKIERTLAGVRYPKEKVRRSRYLSESARCALKEGQVDLEGLSCFASVGPNPCDYEVWHKPVEKAAKTEAQRLLELHARNPTAAQAQMERWVSKAIYASIAGYQLAGALEAARQELDDRDPKLNAGERNPDWRELYLGELTVVRYLTEKLRPEPEEQPCSEKWEDYIKRTSEAEE